MPTWFRSTVRPSGVTAVAFLLMIAPAQAANPAPFDLSGPVLRIMVTRGNATLPIGQVPALATGDKLAVRAELPDDQTSRFILISALLHGATNPPPKDWIRSAETWKKKAKDNSLAFTLPKGARQLALFLVPETGGAVDAISSTIRARPGEFVRATQDLNQASLDRSRLDAFMRVIQAEGSSHPEDLSRVAPTLAQSLSIKLNDQCLARMVEMQAPCLLENRDALVLADSHSASMAETLAGTPADLALQISATREAGLGYYSPYIGVIRDVAHIFGAFGSPQFNYLPTISLRRDDAMALLLNAAPSFAKPKSVLVAAMPAIEDDQPPRLRSTADGPICAGRPEVVLPVAGAPLIYSTGYAREMVLTLGTGKDAKLIPVQARADKGGYVLDTKALGAVSITGQASGRLSGFWGFDRFQGPQFQLQFPEAAGWHPVGDLPPIGSAGTVTLQGAAPACIDGIALRNGSAKARAVSWQMTGGQGEGRGIALSVTAKDMQEGELTIEIRQAGMAKPSIVAIPIRAIPIRAMATVPPPVLPVSDAAKP